MKYLLAICCFCAYPVVAGSPVYEANITHNGYRSAARAICVFDETRNELQITFTHNLADVRRVYVGMPSQNKAMVVNTRDDIVQENMDLSTNDYRDLVSGKLTITVQTRKELLKANFKRVYNVHAYHVTVTNITRGQVFAPPVVVSHMRSYQPFTPGAPPSDNLAAMAEEGDGSGVLADVLSSDYGYHGTVGQEPIHPGDSVTLTVLGGGRFSDLSVMGMLVSTNDAFFAATNIQSFAQPAFKSGGISYITRTHGFAYDAGSEANNEDCAHIPGCGGAGSRATDGAEGYIHMHNGIYGHGVLDPATYDWRGPVAAITVDRASDAKTLVINNTTVVDGTGADPESSVNVVIEGNRITAITTDAIDAGPMAEVVDGTGKFIVPGFIDMHTHYWETGAPDTSPTITDFRHVLPWEDHISWINNRAAYTFSRFLCGGITTMVEQSSPNYAFDLRRATEQLPYASRLRLGGRFIGNNDFGFNFWTEEDPAVVMTHDPEEARAWVAEALDLGADHTKVGYLPSPDEKLEDWFPVFDAMLEETHSRGKKLAIHVTEVSAAKEFIKRGADILAHPLWETPPDQEFFDLAKEHGVFVTTTLFIWDSYINIWSLDPELTEMERTCGDQQVIDTFDWLNTIPTEQLPEVPAIVGLAPEYTANAVATIAGCYQAGIPLVVGSDAGNVGLLGGPSIHREFDYMADAGVPPGAILQAATYNAAVALDLDHELGAVKEGYLADLLILSADPTEDHRNLALIDYIIKDGNLLPHSTLQKLSDDTPPVEPVSTFFRAVDHVHGRQQSVVPHCH